MTEPKYNMNEKRVDKALAQITADGQPHQALHPTIDDLARRRMVDAVINRMNKTERSLPNPYLVTSMAVAAGLLLAVALYAVFSNDSSEQAMPHDIPAMAVAPSATTVISQQIFQSRFALLHGEVVSDNTSIKLGSRVPTNRWIETSDGQVAFSLPTGIAVGLSKRTSARVKRDEKRAYSIEIKQGMALFSVNPKKERDAFFVSTPRGKVMVTGTLFTVQVKEDGEVLVHLHKGRVNIEPTTGAPLILEKGQVAHLNLDGGQTITDAADTMMNKQVVEQMQKVGCMDEGQIFSELDNAVCTGIDTDAPGEDIGPTGRKPQQRTVSAYPSAARLLQDARLARKERRFSDSARALNALVRHYPHGNDARSALVSLGRLELNNLGKPTQAIIHFTRYLKQPGPLTQEALWGKANAERVLGKAAKETATLEQLVHRFPNDPAANSARKRLSQLQ